MKSHGGSKCATIIQLSHFLFIGSVFLNLLFILILINQDFSWKPISFKYDRTINVPINEYDLLERKHQKLQEKEVLDEAIETMMVDLTPDVLTLKRERLFINQEMRALTMELAEIEDSINSFEKKFTLETVKTETILEEEIPPDQLEDIEDVQDKSIELKKNDNQDPKGSKNETSVEIENRFEGIATNIDTEVENKTNNVTNDSKSEETVFVSKISKNEKLTTFQETENVTKTIFMVPAGSKIKGLLMNSKTFQSSKFIQDWKEIYSKFNNFPLSLECKFKFQCQVIDDINFNGVGNEDTFDAVVFKVVQFRTDHVRNSLHIS